MKMFAALFLVGLAGPLQGMEFYFDRPPPVFSSWGETNSILYMKGDIRAGDYVKFQSFLRDNASQFVSSPRIVILNSNGGDLAEALRIADLMKIAMVNVYVVDGKCASACFFLFLNATYRFSEPYVIGVHRPYFDKRYFSGLTPSQAEKRQNELAAGVKRILDEDGVPRELTERMYSTASTGVHWLTDDEIDKLGKRPAWYEELLIAKCGLDKNLEDSFVHSATAAARAKVQNAWQENARMVASCEHDLAATENQRLFAELRKSNKRR